MIAFVMAKVTSQNLSAVLRDELRVLELRMIFFRNKLRLFISVTVLALLSPGWERMVFHFKRIGRGVRGMHANGNK